MRLLALILLFVCNPVYANFDVRTFKAQSILNYLSYPAGTEDGLWGGNTEKAIQQFSSDMGFRYSGQLDDQFISLLERAYSDKSGEFPLFGSKGVNLPLKMPRTPVPNGATDWTELLKTELHDLNIDQIKFEPIQWHNYLQATNTADSDDNYTLAMIKGADCISMNYDFHYNLELETPEPYAWCNYLLRRYLPKVGPSALQSIFNHWSEKSIEDYSPNYRSDTNSYILQQHYAHLVTTYALFYDQFNNHESIDKWLIEWGIKYENTRTMNNNNCPYHDPFLMKADKIKDGKFKSAAACGSQKWRGSIARIALGLQTKNKDIYLSGVRQLETLLGMFDKNGIYVHYATRGWDSLGYMADVPNYLADLALLFENIGFDLYAMKTNSGFSVGELVANTNDFLKNPQNYTSYFEGTRNERPDEQPKYFGKIADYGGVDQWRRERSSTDKEIILRSFHYYHYKAERGDTLPNYFYSVYSGIIRSFNGKFKLPDNLLFGWNSGVPQILSVIERQPKIWSAAFGDVAGQQYFKTYEYKDFREDLKTHWDNLQRNLTFDLKDITNLGAQNLFYETLNAKWIDFDVYLVPDGATRGLYGVDKAFDKKLPLKIAIDNFGDVLLRESTYLTDLPAGSKIGKVSGDLILLNFAGKHCDHCGANEAISIIVSLPLFLGASNSSAENGQKILLRPMVFPTQKNDTVQAQIDVETNPKNAGVQINLPNAHFFTANGLGETAEPISLGENIKFDVFFAKEIEGFLDRKMPITLQSDGSEVTLVEDGFIVDDWDTFESKLENENIIISFRGYLCDGCAPDNVEILINSSIGLGISLTSANGYRTLLVHRQ